MKNQFIQIIVSVPDGKTASLIAEKLLDAKLAACVQLSSQVTSYYRWKGKIEKDPEIQLQIKTSLKHFKEVEKMIVELHPYDVPEIIALSILQASTPYLSWMSGSLKE